MSFLRHKVAPHPGIEVLQIGAASSPHASIPRWAIPHVRTRAAPQPNKRDTSTSVTGIEDVRAPRHGMACAPRVRERMSPPWGFRNPDRQVHTGPAQVRAACPVDQGPYGSNVSFPWLRTPDGFANWCRLPAPVLPVRHLVPCSPFSSGRSSRRNSARIRGVRMSPCFAAARRERMRAASASSRARMRATSAVDSASPTSSTMSPRSSMYSSIR